MYIPAYDLCISSALCVYLLIFQSFRLAVFSGYNYFLFKYSQDPNLEHWLNDYREEYTR